MATLTIHNISDDLLEKLERSAMERGLSVEDEAIRRILSTKFALNERERGGAYGERPQEQAQNGGRRRLDYRRSDNESQSTMSLIPILQGLQA